MRWFVDGSEVEQARGRYSYALRADGGRHDVRVTIEDCTGGIRIPGAQEQIGAVAWTVSNEPGITASKALAPPARIGSWIRMRVDSSGHSVLGITLGEPRRAQKPGGSDDSGFEYALFDAGGAMLAAGKVADPRVIRGPLGSPGAPGLGHATRTLPEWLLPDWNSRRRRRPQAADSETGGVQGKGGAGSGIRRDGVDRAVARSVVGLFLARGRNRFFFPGTLHLVGPMLVVRPGVEILGDCGMTPARALHSLEPGGISVGAHRWRCAVR